MDQVRVNTISASTNILLRSRFSEEGARFPISMVASGVWAGAIPVERAHSLQEVGGGKQTMKEALGRIRYLGEIKTSYKAMPIGVLRTCCFGKGHSNGLRLILNCTLSKDPAWKRKIKR